MSIIDEWEGAEDQDIEKFEVDKNIISVPTKEIARRIKSFDHFVYLWGHKANYFLPPKHSLTWHFISQILSGNKKLLKNDIVGRCIDMPKVRGYRIKDIYSEFCKRCDINNYLPNISETDCIPRNYFFNAFLLGPKSYL